MKVTLLPGGSLEIRESATVVRAALLVGAGAVVWGVVAGGHRGDTARVALGCLCAAMMVVATLLIESRRVIFDRATGAVHWRRARLFTRTAGAIPFSEVTAVIAQPRTRRFTYRPVLLARDEVLELSNSTSLSGEDFAGLLALAREAVGLREAEEDPVTALVRAGRIFDAVVVLRRATGLSLADARAWIRGRQRRISP